MEYDRDKQLHTENWDRIASLQSSFLWAKGPSTEKYYPHSSLEELRPLPANTWNTPSSFLSSTESKGLSQVIPLAPESH
jgi:hypothetical protein